MHPNQLNVILPLVNITSHVNGNIQSEYFISELHSYAALKFVYDTSCWSKVLWQVTHDKVIVGSNLPRRDFFHNSFTEKL